MRFQDKVALVTGGSSGIGQAVAGILAGEGGKVAVVSGSSLEKAQQAIASFDNAAQLRSRAYVADVTDTGAIKDLVQQVATDLGDIDILVNSAGLFYPTPVDGATEEAFDRMMDVNLKAMFFAIAEVAPAMKANGGGKIVNLSSVAGVIGVSQHAVYCASKAAVIMLTRTLALELAPYRINVNAVAPGNTETPMNEPLRNDQAFAAMLEGLKQATPSPRTFTPPTEMAQCVAFLASDAAASMYGSTLLADEGVSAGL